MSRNYDLTGKVFGKLTVIREDSARETGNRRWICKCDCGNETVIITRNLNSGNTKSCGCLRGKSTTHGHSTDGKVTSEYLAWYSMRRRCNYRSHPEYEYYGGRGIKVCERWESFECFIEDMGAKPSKNHTLERIDNQKGYSKDNCEWATWKTQSRNRRVRNINKSGHTGVGKSGRKWRARITLNGKNISLGSYSNIEDAIKAREQAELKYW